MATSHALMSTEASAGDERGLCNSTGLAAGDPHVHEHDQRERSHLIAEGLRTILGHDEGRLRVAAKMRVPDKKPKWIPACFEYPGQVEQAAAWLADHDRRGHDTYFIPYVGESCSAKKGSARSRRRIHADVDPTRSRTAEVPTLEAVEALGGFMVESGSPGHAHVYIPLTTSLSVEDHHELCEQLNVRFDGDNKTVDCDYLRPPGTRNWKTSPPTEVRLVPSVNEPRPQDPDVLRGLLPPVPERAASASLISIQGGGDISDAGTTRGRSAELITDAELYFHVKCGHRPARYKTNSDAGAAVALHLIRKGYDYEVYDAVMRSPENACSQFGRYLGPEGRRRTRSEWEGARRLAEKNPAQHNPEYFRAAIHKAERLLEAPWPGRTGARDRAVMSVLLGMARERNSIYITASTRQIAEGAGISQSTASRSLKQLKQQGLVEVVDPGHAAQLLAPTYRVDRVPAHVDDDPAPPRIRLPVDDLFTKLGPVAKEIYEAVASGTHTAAQITQLTGRAASTVRKHLTAMRADGIITQGDDRTWRVSDDKTRAKRADELGWAGERERKRQRHNTDRAQWQKATGAVVRSDATQASSRQGAPIVFGQKVGATRTGDKPRQP
jgi:DNA-binding transcriptional ArsR family regulator